MNIFPDHRDQWKAEIERQVRQMNTWWQQLWKRLPASPDPGGFGDPGNSQNVPPSGGGGGTSNAKVYIGFLTADLAAPADPATPTTGTMQPMDRLWQPSGSVVNFSNRSKSLSGSSGTFCIVIQGDIENSVVWIDCSA